MCGIAGEIRFDSRAASDVAVRAINDHQAPRGPDDEGIVTAQGVVLGQRRLKVVDLSDRAAQPMVDDDLGLSIVFNGCIYNHDIRTALVCFGADATHGYERCHEHTLLALGELLSCYVQSPPTAKRDRQEMGPLAGFSHLPINREETGTD